MGQLERAETQIPTLTRRRFVAGLALGIAATACNPQIPGFTLRAESGFCSSPRELRNHNSDIADEHTFTVSQDTGLLSNSIRSLLVLPEGVLLGYAGELKDNVSFLRPQGFEICGPDVRGHVNALGHNISTGELFAVTDGQGVYRREGEKWFHYNRIPGPENKLEGLADHRGYCLSFDGPRTLVGTLDGVSMWDKDRWKPRSDLASKDASNQRIHALLVNGSQTWVGYVMEGLFVTDGTNQTYYRENQPAEALISNSVRSIILTPDQSVWVAAGPGTSSCDLKTGQWTRRDIQFPDLKEVLNLTLDHKNRVLAATNKGTFLHDNGWQRIHDSDAFSVGVGVKGGVYDENKLFIGTTGDGLVQMNLP